MKVKVAKTAGFCFGVKRAVDLVYGQVKEAKEQTKDQLPVYTYGPIIHNEEVVADLKSKNVEVIDGIDDLPKYKKGKIVIRSHGISKKEYDALNDYGMQIIDATCPFVKRIHKIVKEASEAGHYVIIIGNPDHPEVQGILGWCGENATAIDTEEDATAFHLEQSLPVSIVSQTTYNSTKFYKLVEIIRKKGYYIDIANTICNATSQRQSEARQISKEVDAMIVIGGRHSSNTQKLYEICKEECENTYYIQTLVDLDISRLQSIDSIGITAGASTPNNIIEEVQTNVIRI